MSTLWHSNVFPKKVYELYTQKHMCDFNLIISDTSTNENPTDSDLEIILCHRIVLVVGSKHFKQELNMESSVAHCEVRCNVTTVQEALRFMYTGQCDISENTLYDLIQLAMDWGIDDLLHEILHRIKQHLSVNNVISLHQFAADYNCTELKRITTYYIRGHFSELCYKLSCLSQNVFATLLNCDVIHINSEEDIFNSVINWIDCHEAGVSSEALVRQIRFHNLSREFLEQIVQPHPRMRDYGEDIEHALENQVQRTHHPNYRPEPWKPKRYWKKPGDNFFVTIDNSEQVLISYNLPHWFPIMDAPNWFTDSFCIVCSHQSGLVITGPDYENDIQHTVVLDVIKQKITRLADLQEAVEKPGIQLCDDWVYLIGGKTESDNQWSPTDTVYRLSVTDTAKLERLSPLPTAVAEPMVAQDEDNLYVLGGSDVTGNNTTHVQTYNIKTNEWTPRADMKHRCSNVNSGCVIQDSELFVFTPTMLMKYDLGTNHWTATEHMIDTNSVKPLVHKGEVIIFDKKTRTSRYNASSRKCAPESLDFSRCIDPNNLYVITSDASYQSRAEHSTCATSLGWR